MSGSSSPSPRAGAAQGLAKDAFRALLARLPTGVTVATAIDRAGRPQGMTASAVASASLEPPLLLVCVDHAADFHAAISGAANFALSILASDQERLSRRFAEDRLDKFTGVPFSTGPGGVPLLDGAAAHVVCETRGAHEAGDHTVFFGQVTGGTTFDRLPLVHYRGGYTTVRGP